MRRRLILLTHHDMIRLQYCPDSQLYLLAILIFPECRRKRKNDTFLSLALSSTIRVSNMIFAPVLVLTGLLSPLAGALAVAPNADRELLPRSPCYTRARNGPIRCRENHGTSSPTVRTLGDNKWLNPKCAGRGESVNGNR